MGKTKRCSACKLFQPLKLFRKNRAQPDGLASDCRPCHSAASLAYRQANPERIKEIEHRRYLKYRAKKKAYYRKRMQTRPEMTRAYGRVQYAKKLGVLKPAKWCQRCHVNSKLIAHHADYSKPLDVEWICRPCHTKEHRL